MTVLTFLLKIKLSLVSILIEYAEKLKNGFNGLYRVARENHQNGFFQGLVVCAREPASFWRETRQS